MSRLPFNPERARGGRRAEPASTRGGDGDRPLTVTQVTDLINRALTDHLPRRLTVIGEISNLTTRGHWYFSLKDDDAVLSCVAWASKTRSFTFAPEHGMQAVASGQVSLYPPQGRVQLYVDRMEPVGAGPLERKYRELCAELRELGYFDPARKKTPPVFPRRVAVITSKTSAALQDVLNTMRQRCAAVGVTIVDTRVQGPTAAPSIVRALKTVRRRYRRARIDAVILTRGGGSLEDLWAFNERIVADALLDYPIPTIAAIGHETDTTIAELVADLRCATPTQAAMRVTPDHHECRGQIDQVLHRLRVVLRHRMRYAEQAVRTLQARLGSPRTLIDSPQRRLDLLARRLAHGMQARLHAEERRLGRSAERIESIRPHRAISRREQTLAVDADRLERAIRLRIEHERELLTRARHDLERAEHERRIVAERRIEALHAVLRGLDPRSVLQRGYSITRDASGAVVRSVNTVAAGDRLRTSVADGQIESEVVGRSNRARKPGSSRPNRRRGAGGPAADQMDLFDELR
ncbi:MAG: exodeoxyribonuclease VII large subunit [Phycisphaerales bacterium]